MGGVALLLWGLHMVRSGIIRAFGSDLRRVLGMAVRNRLMALLAGIGLTAVLQSSTATGLMAASFAAAGHIDLGPALAVMLGANIGTTLIVQLLSFNVSAVAPVLFIIGLVAFNRGRRTWIRDIGRVAIGLGLMLLFLGSLARSGRDALLGARAPQDRFVVLGALFGILTLAIHSLSDFAVHIPAVGLTAVVLAARICGPALALRAVHATRPRRARRNVSWAVAGLATALPIALVSAQGVTLARAELALARTGLPLPGSAMPEVQAGDVVAPDLEIRGC